MKHPNLSVAHSYHWLYCYAHSCFQKHAFTYVSIVKDRWILVHSPAYSMSCKFPDYSIALSLTMALNCITNITKMMTGLSCFYSLI